MSTGREIRCFDYVNHPYEQVREALIADAATVFQAATKAAASRAQSAASELRVNIGGIGVATDVTISVQKVRSAAGLGWKSPERNAGSPYRGGFGSPLRKRSCGIPAKRIGKAVSIARRELRDASR
jgi:hypothetical protein